MAGGRRGRVTGRPDVPVRDVPPFLPGLHGLRSVSTAASIADRLIMGLSDRQMSDNEAKRIIKSG
jgi:hypothetical protein